MALILQLDVNGQPNTWITWQEAAVYHAKGQVSWSLGENETLIRGGDNRITGEQSVIRTASIIAVKGEAKGRKRHRPPALCNRDLFRRDRYMCAYCGGLFKEAGLSRDHIHPRSLGGVDTWMNTVTACLKCNQSKDDKTLDQAGMQLLYAPYIPSKAEHLILSNRNILADQMEFLLSFIDEKSRIREPIKKQ